MKWPATLSYISFNCWRGSTCAKEYNGLHCRDNGEQQRPKAIDFLNSSLCSPGKGWSTMNTQQMKSLMKHIPQTARQQGRVPLPFYLAGGAVAVFTTLYHSLYNGTL